LGFHRAKGYGCNELLSKVQDMCEAVCSVSNDYIRADRFFEDALSEAKDIPSPSDEFEKSRQLVATDVTATILRDVDEADLRLFKDFFTETETHI
jgi:hypothetical protein